MLMGRELALLVNWGRGVCVGGRKNQWLILTEVLIFIINSHKAICKAIELFMCISYLREYIQRKFVLGAQEG